jgi:hypothetical protein
LLSHDSAHFLKRRRISPIKSVGHDADAIASARTGIRQKGHNSGCPDRLLQLEQRHIVPHPLRNDIAIKSVIRVDDRTANPAIGLGAAVSPTGAEFDLAMVDPFASVAVEKTMGGCQNQIGCNQRPGAKPRPSISRRPTASQPRV